MDLTRKQFLESLASSTVVLLVSGCGGGGSDSTVMPAPAQPPPGPAATCGSSGAAITGNHGHALTVAASDLDSTTDKTYDIQGTSNHNHTITLTPAQLTSLKTAGATVTVRSSDTGHTHDVTVSCA